jgi:hypothetical protein
MATSLRLVRAEGASRDLATDYIIAAMGIDRVAILQLVRSIGLRESTNPHSRPSTP